jgi:HlyD family secretion protein
MRRSAIFVVAALGLLAGVIVVWHFSLKHPPQPPVFVPASDPYAQGIFATGIIESDQGNGENVLMYPEVSGTVVSIPVHEGQNVRAGEPLLQLDTSI